MIFEILTLVAVCGVLVQNHFVHRRVSASLYTNPQPPVAAHHTILNEAGEVLHRIPVESGITEELKQAGRTPGLRIQWAHRAPGDFEYGQE